MEANPVTEWKTRLGEGPVWNPDTGLLHWVDLLVGDVLGMSPLDGVVERRNVGTTVSAMRPVASGGLVLAVERGFAFLADGEASPALLPELWDDPSVRMNDGGCDPQGRFYAGSMAYDERPGAGRLWRMDHDGQCAVVVEDVTISNGLAWSQDGELVYYADTATDRVDTFSFDATTGTFSDRRPFVTIDSGAPDGLTLDAEGRVWVALWGGGAVRCYSPSGELLEIIELPVRNVTACTFGGANLDELFITTAAPSSDPEPLAGSLFHVIPGAKGLPVQPYTGRPRNT
jgi:sugar lactone lactonase YvrE